MQVAAKKRFRIEEYVTSERANPIIQNIGQESQILNCICKTMTENGKICFKCKNFVHACLAFNNNREDLYECASCLNKSMDPLFQVKKILNQSYFRTQSIFQYSNLVNFQFTLKPEDMQFIVEVRGIIPGQSSLSWPMQGGFCINQEKLNFYELKPLLINSNRKARREEYFTIPEDKLKIGKNHLKFKIPCLDRGKFTCSYQYEEKKQYYFAINLVKRLSPTELQTLTFRQHRIERKDSLQILKQNNSDVQVTQNKVSLMCPYTRERIKVPVRGRYCKHFSCICLQTLISTHCRTRFWNCPICECKINQPYVDIWIYNMLIDNQRGSQVMVKEGGTYQWVKQAEEQMVDLDSEEQSAPYKAEQPPKPVDKAMKPVQGAPILVKPAQKMQVEVQVKESNPKNKEIVIDIEDDEEEPYIQQSRPKEKVEGIKKVQSKMISQEVVEDKSAKRKQLLQRMKNHINENIERPSIKQPQRQQTLATQPYKEKEKQSVLPSFSQAFEKKIVSRREEKVQIYPQPIKPVIYDIIPMQVKTLKPDEFKKIYFKGKTYNKYKKYVHTEELRKLFKEIL